VSSAGPLAALRRARRADAARAGSAASGRQRREAQLALGGGALAQEAQRGPRVVEQRGMGWSGSAKGRVKSSQWIGITRFAETARTVSRQ
jgi:hypothetical protein